MYVKVFNQIFDSSIAEDYETRRMFMDLLVLADRQGFVDITAESISRRTNVPLDLVCDGIGKLCEPDPRSRSTEQGGARLRLIDPENRDWGWQIINYDAYRGMRDEEGRRAYMRDLMRQKRAKANKDNAVSTALAPVSTRKQSLAHADADAELKKQADFDKSARLILSEYKKLKPPSMDDSRGRAKKALISLLKKHKEDKLLRAVRNYATLDIEPQFRRGSGNFFGRDKDWAFYSDPKWKPETDTTTRQVMEIQ